jgi:hypothetical protein
MTLVLAPPTGAVLAELLLAGGGSVKPDSSGYYTFVGTPGDNSALIARLLGAGWSVVSSSEP